MPSLSAVLILAHVFLCPTVSYLALLKLLMGRLFMLGERDCKPQPNQWWTIRQSLFQCKNCWRCLLLAQCSSTAWSKAMRLRAPGRAGELLDVRLWGGRRKNMLVQWALTLCSVFSFSWMIAMDGRGCRGSSLDSWSHCRFCIFSVSVLHLINKHLSGGINLGCKWEST